MADQSTRAMKQELKTMAEDEAVQKDVRRVVEQLEVFGIRKNGTLTTQMPANGSARAARPKARTTGD